MAKKARDAFRTISEVANWLDVPAHVLRFWESKFTQIKPVKRAGGRRYYRPADMRLIGGIKMLLHDDGLTIRGVQKMLKEDGVKKISALSPPLDMPSEEEGAARRTARRARRKARIDERTTGDAGTEVVEDMTAPTPTVDAPEAPFLHVEEDDPAARVEDNVVSFQMQPAESAETVVDAMALEASNVSDDTDHQAEDVQDTPDDTPHPAERAAAAEAALPDVPADPPPSSGAPSADQQNAIALLKRLRGLEVSTHLADGSETALGTLHTRLIALRDRMCAESAAR